jgi:hypothetical protein
MAALSEEARATVQEKLRDAKRLADCYVEDCARFYVGPKSQSLRPSVPAGLDPSIARLIRSEVEEAALVLRTSTAGAEGGGGE